MTVRLYEWDKTETGWAWIEITDNKVVNLILRNLNNLIKINSNNEVYVDLQLDDNLQSSATLPVGVTTWRVVQANWRPVTGTLISAKTTSGDVAKILYGDDGKIRVENWDGTWETLQFSMTAGTGINITNDVVSNTWVLSVNSQVGDVTVSEFLPENTWSTWQVLKKNWDTYRWANESWGWGGWATYYAGTWINIDLDNVISNTLPFNPDSTGSQWQVLTKWASGYDWGNVNDIKVSSTVPSNPTEWMVWYDTTNDVLKTYDGSNWNNVANPEKIRVFDVADLTTQSAWEDFYNFITDPTNTAFLKTTWDGQKPIVLSYSNCIVTDPLHFYYFSAVTQTAHVIWATVGIGVVSGSVTSVNTQTNDLWISQFSPTSTWSQGQVLTKWASGYDWANAPVTSVNWNTWAVTVSEVPAVWTDWQVLTVVSGSPAWANASGWDVSYADFETATSVWATVTLSYMTTQITPSSDFTVTCWTVKEWMQYILRINSWATAYTMTLGTGITNPFWETLTLTANKMTTVVFFASSSSTLEVFSVRTAS